MSNNSDKQQTNKWPGLFMWLGEGVFRTLGYLMLFCSGVFFTQQNSLMAMLGSILIGHVSICAAEVIDEMSKAKT